MSSTKKAQVHVQVQVQSKRTVKRDGGGGGDVPAMKLPPPPCAGAQPPLRRSRSLRRSLRKNEDDPFLIAYIECTKSGGGRDDQKRAGVVSKGATQEIMGFGIKKNLSRLSCKHSGHNAIDNSIVRVSQIRPSSSKISQKFFKKDQV